MPYQADITRSNPILFVFLLDQSGSMSTPLGKSGLSKAEGIADAINSLLVELILRGTKGDKVRDYCEVAILGYGAQPGKVMPAFRGKLAGKEFIKISEIASFPSMIKHGVREIPDGVGGTIEVSVELPVWIEPTAGSDTPMARAFQRAYDLVSNWSQNHLNSFPPIVINITDGESTDEDPIPYAQKIKDIKTEDGNTLLFNCYISSNSTESPILFPDDEAILPDSYIKKLFEISSRLPPTMVGVAIRNGIPTSNKAHGFAYQPGLSELTRFVKISTLPQELGSSPLRFAELDERITQNFFDDHSIVVVNNSPSEITFHTPENQKLTPAFLLQVVSPYIVAIAEIQRIFDEIHTKHNNKVIVRSITQNSPISVSLDGASDAIKTVQENVVPWRRENAKKLAEAELEEKQVSIEVLKAETLEKRANAAKSRAEAEKMRAEAEKQRQEAEQLKLANEKGRIEIERAKIQLALDIIEGVAPNLSTTEKMTWLVKLLPSLNVVLFSIIEVLQVE